MVLCLVFCCSLAACKDDEKAPENQLIYYNLTSEPDNLDPQLADSVSSRTVILNLFEGLARLDEKEQAVPGAAQSWSANSDHTVFTFQLRKDACWPDWTETKGEEEIEHKAEPVTAADFVFGFQRALSPSTGSSTAGSLYAIQNAEAVHKGELEISQLGVRAQGDYTLVIELEYSYEDFPRVTALPVAMPCHEAFFLSTGGQYGLEAFSVLGNGPFKFTNRYQWEHNTSLQLSVNSAYRGEQTPVPAGVKFTIGADLGDLVNAIANGKVDASPLSGAQQERATEQGFHLTSFADTTWGLCFNTQDPYFQHLDLRKSFVQSLDRAALLSSLPAQYAPYDGIVAPQTTLAGKNYRELAGGGFYLPFDENTRVLFNNSLAAARQNNPTTEEFEVKVLCLDNPDAKRLVNSMVAMWNEQLGRYFNLTPLSEEDLLRRLKNGSYTIALAPLRAENDGPADFLSMFRSTKEGNPAGLKSAEYDALLDTAEGEEIEASVQTYAQAERYLSEQAVFYPLYSEQRYYASAPNVTGILFHSYDGGVEFIGATKVVD